MGNAGRDPVFWATLAIAEQDFDGSGDLCIRCHSAGGWYGGRSTPTYGSGLAASDDNGIDCDTCHTSTNLNNSEHLGVMNSPFIANCDPDPNVPNKCNESGGSGEGFYGSGMLSLWSGSDKLGPYDDAAARHQFMASQWHRDTDFCGTCHDVSNPVVGGNNAQVANDDNYSTDQDATLDVAAPGVLGNDTDADSDPFTALQVTPAGNGIATLNDDGSFSYTPNAGYTGTDSFTYYANDGTDDSNVATVNITVNSVGSMACSDYTAKGDCNIDPNCEWVGKGKTGTCQDAAAGGTEDVCDDGIDNDGDGATDCDDADCNGDPACQIGGTCNNDGICDPGEDCNTCASDCAGVTGGKPSNRYCCGNGVAEGPEGDGSICDGNY